MFKKKLILFILIIFSINLVNSSDNQAFISCGGDNELIIGCNGDNENSFFGSTEFISTNILSQSGSNLETNKSFIETENLLILISLILSLPILLLILIPIIKKKKEHG